MFSYESIGGSETCSGLQCKVRLLSDVGTSPTPSSLLLSTMGTICRIRVKPDKTGVDLAAVKMSMNPFDEVRAPPLVEFAALGHCWHDAAHKRLTFLCTESAADSSAGSTGCRSQSRRRCG